MCLQVCKNTVCRCKTHPRSYLSFKYLLFLSLWNSTLFIVFLLSFCLLRAISKGSMWASRIGSTTPVEPWRASLVRHLRNVKPAAFRSFISHPPHFGGSSIVCGPLGQSVDTGWERNALLAPKKLHPDVCCLFATVLVQHSTAQYQHMKEAD